MSFYHGIVIFYKNSFLAIIRQKTISMLCFLFEDVCELAAVAGAPIEMALALFLQRRMGRH